MLNASPQNEFETKKLIPWKEGWKEGRQAGGQHYELLISLGQKDTEIGVQNRTGLHSLFTMLL